MSKRPSEYEFGKALRAVDLRHFVFRPADALGGDRKPCDFMVWHVQGQSRTADATWFECKDVNAVGVFNLAEVRPSQRLGIAEAERLGIPYWLAVYWRRHKSWTISDAVRVFEFAERVPSGVLGAELVVPLTAITRTLLMSRFGIESSPSTLVSTLKGVLLGEAD